MPARSAIVDHPVDPTSLLAEVASIGSGATSLFIGTVRNTNAGKDVTGIDYRAYRPMAERELARIVDEIVAKYPETRVAVEHRIGTLALGEVSVAVAVSHERRAAAIDAAREIIEQIKKRVPIWKREHYADGSRDWVDPTATADDTGNTGDPSADAGSVSHGVHI